MIYDISKLLGRQERRRNLVVEGRKRKVTFKIRLKIGKDGLFKVGASRRENLVCCGFEYSLSVFV